jgi:WD40 repeat protein
MKRITWFDFLCALALLFSACTSAVKTGDVEDESDVIGATMSVTQTSTPSPIGPVPTRTLDLYRPDTVRETYAAEQATKDAAIATQWASGPTSTPRPKSTSMPSSTPIPTTDLEATFSGRGPWLVYGKSTGDEGFFATNANGSGRKLVNIPEDYPGRVAFSPSGFQMAYHTYASEVIDQTLVVARFPDGKILAEIPLFAGNWSDLYGDQPGWWETDRAVGQALWSPGGRYLAFVGALHGPSSDLYVFDLSTKEVRRLTAGPYQVMIMDWSPDGEWVVHQSVMSFGTGAGITGEAVWAAALDGSGVRHLYDAPRQQTLADWVDPFRFVVYEWGQPCGSMNILRASIKDGVALLVYEGPLRIDYWEDLVFSADQGVAILNNKDLCPQEGEPFGIYLTSIRYLSEPQLVLSGDWTGISYWEERGLFLSIGGSDEVVGFRGDGEVVFRTEVARGEGMTIPAPKNFRFAIYNDQGAWLYDWEGKLIRQVMNRSVEEFLWSPDGRTFYMLIEEDHTLYVGDAYSGGLMIVDTDVDNLMLIG